MIPICKKRRTRKVRPLFCAADIRSYGRIELDYVAANQHEGIDRDLVDFLGNLRYEIAECSGFAQQQPAIGIELDFGTKAGMLDFAWCCLQSSC